jgi:four helix bundle protein
MEAAMDAEIPRTIRDMDVWKRALCLAELTYRATRSFPAQERYGLCAQMRRAALSVLSNISEGAARRTRADYVHFLHIARGSLAELDAQLALSIRLQFEISDCAALQAEVVRVGQLINAVIRSLRVR